MSTPGAATATWLPWFEAENILSALSVALTPMTFESAAGKSGGPA